MKFYQLFFATLFISFNVITQTGAQPGMGDLTPDELAQLEQQLEFVENYVAGLSPEEQEQFYKNLEEATEIVNNMSEDEKNELFNVIKEQFQAPAQEVSAPTPEPVPEVKPAPVIEEPKIENLPKIDKALKTLNTIIARIERFLRQSHQIPELSGTIEQWISKKKMKDWQIDLSWTILKADIEALNQRFHTLKESVDPKTKKYRYLDDLIASEALYNNIQNLGSCLTTHEPHVEAPEFGLGKISQESFAAVKSVLECLAESLYTLKMVSEIDAIIARYEPRAKVLLDESQAERKRASEESKLNPAKLNPATVVGGHGRTKTGSNDYAAHGNAPYQYNQPYHDYNNPYNTDNYGGYDDRYDTYQDGSNKASAGDHGHEKGITSTPEKSTQEPSEKQKGEKDNDTKKEKSEKKQPIVPDMDLENRLTKLSGHLEKIAALLDSSENLMRLEQHIDSNSKKKIDEELTREIPIVVTSMKMVNKTLRNLKTDINLLTPDQIEHYKKRLGNIIDEYMQDYFASLLSGLSVARGRALSPAMQKAYFTDPAGNLNDLIAELNELKKIHTEYVSFIDTKKRSNKDERATIQKMPKAPMRTNMPAHAVEQKNLEFEKNLKVLDDQTDLLTTVLRQSDLLKNLSKAAHEPRMVQELMATLHDVKSMQEQVDALYALLTVTTLSKHDVTLLYKSLESMDAVCKTMYDQLRLLEENKKSLPELVRYAYFNEQLPDDASREIKQAALQFTKADRVQIMVQDLERLMQKIQVVIWGAIVKSEGGSLQGEKETITQLLKIFEIFEGFMEKKEIFAHDARLLADDLLLLDTTKFTESFVVTLELFMQTIASCPEKNRAIIKKHLHENAQQALAVIEPTYKTLTLLADDKEKPLNKNQRLLFGVLVEVEKILHWYLA